MKDTSTQSETPAQCSLCTPGACHDDACPHGVGRKVSLHEFIMREIIDPAFVDCVLYGSATIEVSNDDVRHVPFGEGKR